MSNKSLFLSVVLITCALVCNAQGNNTINIGFIDSNPTAIVSKNNVVCEYLTKKLKDSGVKSVQIVVAANTDEMIKILNAGKADIFIDSIYPVMLVGKSVKFDLKLRRWKKGVGEYKTLFITRQDSPLTNLKNLKGKIIGFEDPTSSSAKWIPQGMLVKAGYKLVEIPIEGTVTADSVGYIYTGAAENMTLWLMQKKIDLACTSSTDFVDISDTMKKNIKIIAESNLYPRQLIAFSHKMNKVYLDVIKKILLGMTSDEEGQIVLKKWETTTKIDALTPEIENTLKEIDQTFTNLKK